MTARASGRRWYRRFVGWPLLTLLAATAFVLGYIGFAARRTDESAIDLAYLTLQLFAAGSGTEAGPSPPLALEIARWMAPAATAYGLGRALLRVYRDEIEKWQLRRRKGHVVVIGLGWLGQAVVEKLVAQGRQVVAVAVDVDEDAAGAMRRSRVPVVIGDARDPEVLHEARVGRAEHVVVLAGADETNTEVALAVGDVYRAEGERPLVCLTHVRAPQLARMLRSKALADHRADGFRLEVFNVAEEAAGIMLDEHAPFLVSDRPARLGVVGGNDVAAAVITEAARIRRLHGGAPLEVVLAGPEDMTRVAGGRYQHLAASAAIEMVPGPPASLAPRSLAELAGCHAVFVCRDDDAEGVAIALDVAREVAPVPVVVALGAWAGVAGMLSTEPAGMPTVHPFLVYDRVLSENLLLAGIGEKLARIVHASYVEQRRAEDPASDAPEMADWRDLPEEYRASNRAQAAHLGVKLHEIGCGLAPLDDWDAPAASLTDEEVERLAILEHDRFVAERKAAGWRLGPRDLRAKTSPYLVSWDELGQMENGEEIRDLDRSAVRAIPSLLARAGYRLVRPAADRSA